MIQKDPEPLTELDRALVECLRIFAWRGRELREAAEKQAADQARSQEGNNTESVVDAPCFKEKDTDANSLKGAHAPVDQQSQAGTVPDQYDI